MQTSIREPGKKTWVLPVLLFYFAGIALFILGAQDSYSISSRMMAWVLFVLTTVPLVTYYFNNKDHVPILELVLLNYALSFSLPVIYQSSHEIMAGRLLPDNVPVTETISYCILAVISLYIGFQAARKIYPAFQVPMIRLACSENKLFIFAVLLQFIHLIGAVNVAPQFAQVLHIAVSPTLNTAILALLFYKGSLSRVKELIAVAIVCLLVVKGVASGMTQSVLEPLLVWFLCRWIVSGKVPVLFFCIGIVVFFLLQPVKLEYRNTVWLSDLQYSQFEKLEIYADIFTRQWLTEGETETVIESTQSRTSLLLSTAHIIDWTPDIVPYKNGETLSYMFTSWVPRFIWPEKPTAQLSNIRYAIDYGVTTELGTKRTTFGIGHLGDVYMNFGLLGVLPIYLILGMLYFLPLHMLQPGGERFHFKGVVNKEIDVPVLALLLASTMNLILIGSSISNVFGGLLQQLVVQTLLLYVFCRTKSE